VEAIVSLVTSDNGPEIRTGRAVMKEEAWTRNGTISNFSNEKRNPLGPFPSLQMFYR
jgi:hypothetical protein